MNRYLKLLRRLRDLDLHNTSTTVHTKPRRDHEVPLEPKDLRAPKATEIRTGQAPRGTLSWHAFSSSDRYRSATRIYKPILSNWCNDAGLWLERAVAGSDREALLLTITFPVNQGQRDSLELATSLQRRLLLLQEEGLTAFHFSTLELHRVQESGKSSGSTSPEEPHTAGSPPNPPKKSPKTKTRPGPKTPDEQPEEVASHLHGCAHLHALLLAPRGMAERFNLLLDTANIGADLRLDFIGGGSISTIRGHRFARQLQRVLRYVAKEYRLEQRESLHRLLPPLREGSLPPAKFILSANPDILESGNIPWDLWLDQLQRSLPGLVHFPVEPQFTAVQVPGVGHNLLRLLRLYLSETQHYLLFTQDPDTHQWEVQLVTRSPQNPQQATIVAKNYEGLYLRLINFFSRDPTRHRELDLLLHNSRTLLTLIAAGAAEIRLSHHGQARLDTQSLTMDDGSWLHWSLSGHGALLKPILRLSKTYGETTALISTSAPILSLYQSGRSWAVLRQRHHQGLSLSQLRRIFYLPNNSAPADELRMVEFLIALGYNLLGHALYRNGIFLWGNPGSGKTPLLKTLFNYAFGEQAVGIPQLGRPFGLQSCLNAKAIILDEALRLRSNSYALQQEKQLLSSGDILVDGKHIPARKVSFGNCVVAKCSNYPLHKLYPSQDLPPMAKRFPHQFQLGNHTLDSTHPLGFNFDIFETSEVGETLVWSLLASDRQADVRHWAAEGLDWRQLLLESFGQHNPPSQELLQVLLSLEDLPEATAQPNSEQPVLSHSKWLQLAYPQPPSSGS